MDFYDPRFPHGTTSGWRHGCTDEAECPNFGTSKPTCPAAHAASADPTPPPAEQSPSATVDSDVVADDLPADVDEPRPEEATTVPPVPAAAAPEIAVDAASSTPSGIEPATTAPADPDEIDPPVTLNTPPPPKPCSRAQSHGGRQTTPRSATGHAPAASRSTRAARSAATFGSSTWPRMTTRPHRTTVSTTPPGPRA